jgi:hypothetical protein
VRESCFNAHTSGRTPSAMYHCATRCPTCCSATLRHTLEFPRLVQIVYQLLSLVAPNPDRNTHITVSHLLVSCCVKQPLLCVPQEHLITCRSGRHKITYFSETGFCSVFLPDIRWTTVKLDVSSLEFRLLPKDVCTCSVLLVY